MALKVYRTPIGFHDSYVAASSQKAGLAAEPLAEAAESSSGDAEADHRAALERWQAP